MIFIKKIIGKIWGVWCGYCGNKLKYTGYYQEKSFCPKCFNK